METDEVVGLLYLLNLIIFVLIILFSIYVGLLLLIGLGWFYVLSVYYHFYGRNMYRTFGDVSSEFLFNSLCIFFFLFIPIAIFIQTPFDKWNFNPIIIISFLALIVSIILIIINVFVIKSLRIARNAEKRYKLYIEQQKKAKLLNKKSKEVVKLGPDKILCSKCKKHYHNPEYNICYVCYMCQEQGIENPEDLAPCKYEKNGVCNLVLEYDKCKKIGCPDYFPKTNKNKIIKEND